MDSQEIQRKKQGKTEVSETETLRQREVGTKTPRKLRKDMKRAGDLETETTGAAGEGHGAGNWVG